MCIVRPPSVREGQRKSGWAGSLKTTSEDVQLVLRPCAPSSWATRDECNVYYSLTPSIPACRFRCSVKHQKIANRGADRLSSPFGSNFGSDLLFNFCGPAASMGINPLLPVLLVLQSVLTTNGRTVASSLYNVADSHVRDSSAQIMPVDIIFIYYLNYLKGNDKKALIRIYRRFVSVSKQWYKLTLQSHCTSHFCI